MMEMRFWEDNSLQHVKFESNSNNNIPPRSREPFYCESANLNFATGDEDCMDYGYRKSQVRVSRQDPLSHRIIEKRRRDRMNNCLADLSRLIPAEYLKKGRGRVEKTEIIEMAIKHMKHLQLMNHYRLGYQDCIQEAMRFMVEVEGHFPREPICVRLLGHLQQHCEGICRSGTDQQIHAAQMTMSAMTEQVGKVEPKIEPSGGYDGDRVDCNENGNGYDVDELENDVNMEQKHEQNGMHEHISGYKYKNDIKLRFSQDSAKTPNCNPQLGDRRNSTPISTDQTCSSLGSPTHFHDSTMQATSAIKPSSEEYDQFTILTTPWTLSNALPQQETVSKSSSLTPLTIRTPPTLSAQKPIAPFSNSITNGLSNGNSHMNSHIDDKRSSSVPAFVLHTKGSFYIPVTLDYQTLPPYLNNQDTLINLQQDVVLHPVAINVNFQQHPLNLQQPKKKFEKLPS